MIALTYFEAAVALVVIAWIGAAAGVFSIAICSNAKSSCTGDCNQGRNCTCRGSRDA
jgi:hypothetical protein